MTTRILRGLPPLLCFLSMGTAWGLQDEDATTAPFGALDDTLREVTNFNVETVRGLAFSPDRSRLWAINTHGSRLLYHSDADGVIEEQWTTVNNPVALDVWDRGVDGYSLIVAGGSSHTVVRHDPTSGAIVDLLIVPSEPGDLVVTPDGHAWVSCRGADVVLEINLATFSVVSTYSIPSERPRFLSWHLDDAVSAGYRVFVAPMNSGNNTVTIGAGAGATSRIGSLPLDNPATPVFEGLPDEDLFEMVPGTSTVFPVIKGIGTLILEHVKHPTSNEMWVLSIVSKNADPARQTEPLLQFDFVDNALTRIPLPAQGATPVQAPAYIDLDDSITGGPKNYAVGTSCSFPVAISIDPLTGYALIASSTNDRLVLVSPAGARVWQRDLPQGSIPRDILVDRTAGLIAVYLWGTNEIWSIPVTDLNAAPTILDLGNDPTPTSVAQGREIWYDAENSFQGRSTCNSCHPGGGSDFIGWQLSDPPLDRKDAMVTQSLIGIEDTFPYHWRGERELRDFNRLAFPGLLGGTSLSTASGGTFDQFKEFLFSLAPPRNPIEDWDRLINDAIAPVGDSAVRGQGVFETKESLFGGFTCAECHSQPEGSNGAINFDNPTFITMSANMDVAHLRHLYNKDGGNINVVGITAPIARLGFGLDHGGGGGDVFDFLNIPAFTILPQEKLDTAAFVNQWDQGIAPAAQLGWLLDNRFTGVRAGDINRYLIAQAGRGWLDVVAFGTLRNSSGATVTARWLFDPSTSTFDANDASIQIGTNPPGKATMTDFIIQAMGGRGSNTFIGVPPGNGRRYALDPDNDGLIDGAESTAGSNPEVPDSDGDNFVDGHEVANGGDPTNALVLPVDNTPPTLVAGSPTLLDVSVSTAELNFEFSEPVTYQITYQRPGDAPLTRSRFHFVQRDTITLQELVPSSQAETVMVGGVPIPIPGFLSTYSLSISMTDRGGNVQSFAITIPVTTDHGLVPIIEPLSNLATIPITVNGLSMTKTSAGSVMAATVVVDVDLTHEILNTTTPAGINLRQNRRVVAQILENTGSGWQVVAANRITGTPGVPSYTLTTPMFTIPGPHTDVLVSPLTNMNGVATINFNVTGLTAGTQVRYNIVAIYTDAGTAVPNDFSFATIGDWHLPSTQDDPGNDKRGVTVTH